MTYRVQGLAPTGEGASLLEWSDDAPEYYAVAWRVLGLRGEELAIYDNPHTARDARNILNANLNRPVT